MKPVAILLLLYLATNTLAQEFVTAGPYAPIYIPVQAGLVTTLYVLTDQEIPPITVAEGFPLPTSLAGFTVEFQYLGDSPATLAPILHVRRISACPSTRGAIKPCATLAAITVQCPWELSDNPIFGLLLAVTKDGKRGNYIEPLLSSRAMRFVSTADLALLAGNPPGFSGPAFVHSDGRPITAQAPARVGEQIAGFLYGLGRPGVPVKTGEPSPQGAAVSGLLPHFRYEYRATQRPLETYPLVEGRGTPLEASWVGLTPGSAGVYQLNFAVPPSSDPIPACSSQGSGSGGPTGNLTISLAPPLTFGTAISICVAPAP